MLNRRIFMLAGLACAALTPSSQAVEYGRFAMGAATIVEGADSLNRLIIRGPDHFPELDGEGNELPVSGSFAVLPFSFAPRDFSLQTLDEITSVRLDILSEPNVANEDGEVEIFFAPSSRADLGFDYDVESADCDWGHDGGDNGRGWSARCYPLTYDSSVTPTGIDASQFGSAPISLGTYELEVSGSEPLLNTLELDFSGAASSMLSQINSDEEFHLVFGATNTETFLRMEDFGNTNRPLLTLNATGAAGGVTKDLIRQGAIHREGDTSDPDFYGTGNDDNFSEFGIGSWQFSREDFGVTEDITDVGSVEIILAHNDRSFSDGTEVAFFFVGDTASELGFVDDNGEGLPGTFANLTYDEEVFNGLDPSQFGSEPVSLGTYPYEPKLGSRREAFDLQLPDEAKAQLVAAINADEDFQIIIAATASESDATFSGWNNAFDPGVPQLSISLEPSVGPTCVIPTGGIAGDLDGDGTVAFPDFLVFSANFGTDVSTYAEGDLDCDGSVSFPDFLTLSANFGQSAAKSISSVPEPSGLGVALPGFLFCGLAFRRRGRTAGHKQVPRYSLRY